MLFALGGPLCRGADVRTCDLEGLAVFVASIDDGKKFVIQPSRVLAVFAHHIGGRDGERMKARFVHEIAADDAVKTKLRSSTVTTSPCGSTSDASVLASCQGNAAGSLGAPTSCLTVSAAGVFLSYSVPVETHASQDDATVMGKDATHFAGRRTDIVSKYHAEDRDHDICGFVLKRYPGCISRDERDVMAGAPVHPSDRSTWTGFSRFRRMTDRQCHSRPNCGRAG